MRQGIGTLLFLISMLLVGCQGDGQANCTEGGALFADDFASEEGCGWVEYSRGGAVAEIEGESLHLTTTQPGEIWWTNPGTVFDDTIITVESQHVEGPDDNAYGVICRYQSNENFYVFLISSDGYYAIGKYQSGSNQITYLTGEGQYQFSEVINQGQARNTIRAACVGNELSLTVNGVLLEAVTDPTFVTGDIGVAASTFESGSLTIAFDSVRVLAP